MCGNIEKSFMMQCRISRPATTAISVHQSDNFGNALFDFIDDAVATAYRRQYNDMVAYAISAVSSLISI